MSPHILIFVLVSSAVFCLENVKCILWGFLLGILRICIIRLQNDLKSCGFIYLVQRNLFIGLLIFFFPSPSIVSSPVTFNSMKKTVYTEIYFGSQYS